MIGLILPQFRNLMLDLIPSGKPKLNIKEKIRLRGEALGRDWIHLRYWEICTEEKLGRLLVTLGDKREHKIHQPQRLSG